MTKREQDRIRHAMKVEKNAAIFADERTDLLLAKDGSYFAGLLDRLCTAAEAWSRVDPDTYAELED